MPPKTAYHKNPRPAFKPPRRVATSSSTASGPTAPDRGLQRAQPSKSRDHARVQVPSISDSESLDDAANEEPEVNSDDEDEARVERRRGARSMDPSTLPAIGPKLLSHLLHEYFRHQETRITREAMAVLSMYMELFTKEAVARANVESEEAAQAGTGQGNDFLEVEDLEKLAPQLLMDF